MRFRSALAALLLSIPLLATHARAEGDGPRLAISASARPMTIGRFNLLLGAEPGVTPGTTSVFLVALPLRFGFSDDLEIFAGPVAQTVDPNVHEPAIGLLYRFLNGPVEVGARAAGDLSLFGATKAATLQLGVPVRIHAGSLLALDLGVHALVGILPQTSVGLLVPAGLSFNLTDSLFVSAASGLQFRDLTAIGSPSIALIASVGYTIPWGDHPFLDLAIRTNWDEIRNPGAFSVGGSVRLYLYLF